MMPHIPCLTVLGLEMTEGRRLPEKVVREHTEQSEEHGCIQEPGTGFGFSESLE
jgi:hypothetical protein